ncbi:hypothetical protein BCR43DRAFT_491230 [Syncephalastrum racemosum]|uniref:Uncharacterized protein n=1 Tax=Syncephalastrum racemosum TaxID=13706 RepID=A0A1X2HBK8_SYNRA|nr:hypothetical protein BCR43DRAFT_491230 [Syncephalastrum racemosum]
MSLAVLNVHQQDELTSERSSPATASNAAMVDRQRRHIIKKKVIAIGRLSRQLSALRENPEMVKEIKRLSSNGKLPVGALALGEESLRQVSL